LANILDQKKDKYSYGRRQGDKFENLRKSLLKKKPSLSTLFAAMQDLEDLEWLGGQNFH